jgi:hypothetical protein
MSMNERIRDEYRNLAARISISHTGRHVVRSWDGTEYPVDPTLVERLNALFPQFKTLRENATTR